MKRKRLSSRITCRQWIEAEERENRERERQEAINRELQLRRDQWRAATLAHGEGHGHLDFQCGYTVKLRLPPPTSEWAPRIAKAAKNLSDLYKIDLYEEKDPFAERIALKILRLAQRSPRRLKKELERTVSLLDNGLQSRLLSAVERLLHQIDREIQRRSLPPTPERTSTEGEPRNLRRKRGRVNNAPRGWISLRAACDEFQIPSSTMHNYAYQLSETDRKKDEDSGQVFVRKKTLAKLLRSKGRHH